MGFPFTPGARWKLPKCIARGSVVFSSPSHERPPKHRENKKKENAENKAKFKLEQISTRNFTSKFQKIAVNFIAHPSAKTMPFSCIGNFARKFKDI